MNRINSLSDLMIEELADLLDAENQLIDALPKITEAAQSPRLKALMEDHREVTMTHIRRLSDVFGNVGQNPRSVVCKTLKGLIGEIEEGIANTEKGPVLDEAIIRMAQRIEYYEITGYSIAQEHADDLGHSRIVELLDKTLNEERSMHLHLSELAQGQINEAATKPQGPAGGPQGFYVPEGKYNRKVKVKKKKNPEVSRFIDEGNPNVQE